ncbi:cobyric acid synthase CobQ [Halorhodospira abdelmalekii]|uniref:cobyric acid synthase n=1 Tax=Halorhodospira abdelmalekii TaxID=421629 RepID=UPI001F5B4EB2|nr:cobyric acid synthase [Halorhodospira abdelmalekii]MBK1734479.1 cobyric acid synthase CobQ [Halorhodospira abdelmalekii]
MIAKSHSKIPSALMLQGTCSGAGKTALVAGLCRLLARRGVRVAPFKPQNMSNNAAVTVDGGEIGRGQWLQAVAAGVEPHSDMNPVLLKPEAERTAQVIVQGRVVGRLQASAFREARAPLLPQVMASFERLRRAYDVVLIEGAGSPAEPNLRSGDIANMGFAQAADVPVWLIGDIDRGGVFASLLGTLEWLDAADRARIKGFVINRFRGALELLGEAPAQLEQRTGVPVLGVVPSLPDLHLPEEDAPYRMAGPRGSGGALQVAVVAYPRLSNHDDFDALDAEHGVQVRFVRTPAELDGADLVVLPGSKQVFSDLQWLQESGVAEALLRHVRYGGRVIGICGGLQMLGEWIDDPSGVEAAEGSRVAGLGLLPVTTRLAERKQLREVSGTAAWPAPVAVSGYEIHYGVTDSSATDSRVADRALGALEDAGATGPAPEGECFPFIARSADGRVLGSYLHRLFDSGPFRRALLAELFALDSSEGDERQRICSELDRLADALEAALAL